MLKQHLYYIFTLMKDILLNEHKHMVQNFCLPHLTVRDRYI